MRGREPVVWQACGPIGATASVCRQALLPLLSRNAGISGDHCPGRQDTTHS